MRKPPSNPKTGPRPGQKSRKHLLGSRRGGADLWSSTLTQFSNLSGVLEEEEPVVVEEYVDSHLETQDVYFGSVRSDIVGVQYYKGTVSNHEMINLVREPQNPYDKFAVRVDNVSNEKVGHIKREHARALSYIVDNFIAKIEGQIPFGANNKFRIPVTVSLWGSPDKKAEALAVIKSHGLPLDSNPAPLAKAASGMGSGLGGASYGQDYGHVVSHRTFVSPKEMEGAMDAMFETLDEGDKTTEAQPVKAVRTALYPHQKQALNWMMCRENKESLPPFWEKKGNGYINTLTIYYTQTKPGSICGGILADDMGLGKTLQVISLVLTNFVDRQPLACPVLGTIRNPLGTFGKATIKESPCVSSSEQTKKVVRKSSSVLSRLESLDADFSASTPKLILNQKKAKQQETKVKGRQTKETLVSPVSQVESIPLNEVVAVCNLEDKLSVPSVQEFVEKEIEEKVRETNGDLMCPVPQVPQVETIPIDKVVTVSNLGDKLSMASVQVMDERTSQQHKVLPVLPEDKTKDPDFEPPVCEKVMVDPPTRSRRQRKRPIRYCSSDDEEVEDVRQNTTNKGNSKGKGVGKRSKPLAVSDENRKENVKLEPVQSESLVPLSCVDAEDKKENVEVLNMPCSMTVCNTSSSNNHVSSIQTVPNQITTPACSTHTVTINNTISHGSNLHINVTTNIAVTEQVLSNQTHSQPSAQTSCPKTEMPPSQQVMQNAVNSCPKTEVPPSHKLVQNAVNSCPKKEIIDLTMLETNIFNKNQHQLLNNQNVIVIGDEQQLSNKSTNVDTIKRDQLPSHAASKLPNTTSSDLVCLFDSTVNFLPSTADDELPDIPTTVTKAKSVSLPGTSLGCNFNNDTGRAKTCGPRGTLIICPLSVISNWVGQFEEHVDPSVHLWLHVYYGSCRKRDVTHLREQDVVITTYSTLASDFKAVKKSPLHQVEWLRVVLDEAHIIRNPSSLQAKAVYELKARRKWAITGTPIQNSMKDLWSLINFLGVKPFTEKVWWNRMIARPLAQRDSKAIARVSHLMRNLAMRRTKNQQHNGKPLVALPDRHVFIEKITFGEEERAVYEAMQTSGQIIIGRYFRQGRLLHHYGEVLAILTRLRQLCCHPQLVANALKKLADATASEIEQEATAVQTPQTENTIGTEITEEERQRLITQLKYVLDSGSDQECAVCLESLTTGVITACAHVYCRACIEQVIDNEQPNPKCPLCRNVLHKNQLIEASGESAGDEGAAGGSGETEEVNPVVEKWQSSAKIDALMKSLNELRDKEPETKSIVVSQFTSLLDLIRIPLSNQGFRFAALDGRMSAAERVRAVQEFSEVGQGTPTIFLLSLKAGGVGINLTAASRVFLMDPAWNPASEEQCFDRCHRLGQTKNVTVTRFVIEDSVEERMLELQEKKRQLMSGAFGRTQSREERRNNLVQMIRNLIQI